MAPNSFSLDHPMPAYTKRSQEEINVTAASSLRLALKDTGCHSDAKSFFKENVADADFANLLAQISGLDECQMTRPGELTIDYNVSRTTGQSAAYLPLPR
jgi:hypothetical protein